MHLGLSLGLHARGGGAASTPAHQQILDLASADGWTAVWDQSNPDTRTTRESGGSTFISAIADGLGNAGDHSEATESLQPILSNGLTLYDGADDKLAASISGLVTADMRFYMVMQTSQATRFICLSFDGTSNLGLAADGDANPANTNMGASATLWVDGVEFPSATRNECYDAIADGNPHLVEFHNVDCSGQTSVWTGRLQGGTPSWMVDGSLGPLLMAETSAISASTHSDIRSVLANAYGITLA